MVGLFGMGLGVGHCTLLTVKSNPCQPPMPILTAPLPPLNYTTTQFMKPMIMQQFFLAATYFLSGDLLTYLAIRLLSDAATVLAVRLQSPGAPVAPLPDSAYEPEPPAARGGAGARESKKDK